MDLTQKILLNGLETFDSVGFPRALDHYKMSFNLVVEVLKE